MKLVIDVKIYAVIFLVMTVIFNSSALNYKNIVFSLLPILFKLYWFITSYILLFLVSPLINKLLVTLSKTTLKNIILYEIILYSILPSIIGIDLFYSVILWFIILYTIGYYIRLHVDIEKVKKNIV